MAHQEKEPDEVIKQLEETIDQAAQTMELALFLNDLPRFQRAEEAWQMAQELWLQTVQNMSPAKAQAVMSRFAADGKFTQWYEQRQPGLPPSVLALYKK